ncbi:DUF2065 domain-containing protein [Geminicoccus roseus]|uniref:DUF2065 domain-containing protein n=1 Tax=Geminicoccus roseus TaxID=404900 RepID=UPI0004005F1C|nr:DUF2065 domain-containing protein [Geminicoccus roseus]
MMNFWQTLALVLVVEGVVWALFPTAMRRLAARAAETEEGALRYGGLAFAVTGVVVVWLLRG